MSTDKKPHGTPALVTGKKFSGEKFVTVSTAEAVASQRDVDAQYTDPNAVDLVTYFTVRRISDPVKRAAMAVYTPPDPKTGVRTKLPRRATVAAFDALFSTF